MKRKYVLLVLPALAIIAAAILAGFVPQSDIGLVKERLTQRTEILQNGFYGKNSAEDTENALFAIETAPLLEDDLHNFRNWDASQLDIVNEMHFLKVEEKKRYFGYVTYDVTISWDMSGLSGDYTTEGDYYVVLKKEGSSYKLSQFDPK